MYMLIFNRSKFAYLAFFLHAFGKCDPKETLPRHENPVAVNNMSCGLNHISKAPNYTCI